MPLGPHANVERGCQLESTMRGRQSAFACQDSVVVPPRSVVSGWGSGRAWTQGLGGTRIRAWCCGGARKVAKQKLWEESPCT